MVSRSIWRRCSSAQDSALMCNIKTGFGLLLTLTLSLSAIAYIYDFSLKSVLYPQTWINHVNQTRINHDNQTQINHDNQSYNVVTKGLPDQKFVWKIKQATTTLKKNTESVHRYVAHPSNYRFVLDEPDKCGQWDPFLVLMVPAAPIQLEARNAIRSTWGNESTVQGKAVFTLFLVGLSGGPDAEKAQQQLEEESRQHRDLIQSNFVDSYFNLTIKTMVMMDWLVTRCPQATYAMKIDTDMYLNVENLMTLLLAPNTPRENYMTGVLRWNRPVVRNKKSKWYVSEELYPEPVYPTYVLGVAYVFSNDLPKKIVEVSKDLKPFNIEDAYVGICLKQLGVKPSQPPDPSQFRTYMKDSKGHNLSKVITTIARSPKQIIEFWKSVKRHT